MDKLRTYIKSLTPDQREEFAKKCGTSLAYIKKILSTNGLFFGSVLCRAIEINSDSFVTRKDLRPHDWHMHWPELAQTPESQS